MTVETSQYRELEEHGQIGDDHARATVAANILKGLAHPLRLRLVALLCRKQEHVGALATLLRARQSIVSQQLRILRLHSLVAAERRGGHAVYRIAEPRLRELIRCLDGCTEDRSSPAGGSPPAHEGD